VAGQLQSAQKDALMVGRGLHCVGGDPTSRAWAYAEAPPSSGSTSAAICADSGGTYDPVTGACDDDGP